MGMFQNLLRRHAAALRALLVLTAVCGVLYPLVVTAVAQLPGLKSKADGSYVSADGRRVGSALIGQSFTDAQGRPLKQYFQSRPSAAGDGYDPASSGASNLGPENVVDTADGPSLLSQVCARSKAVGELEGVDGRRPYCTPGGAGAVLAVFGPRDTAGTVPHPTRVISVNEPCPATPFLAEYRGARVECAAGGQDYRHGVIVPVRGDAPARPAVPSDAVTASGSGLDPDISPAYARLQAPRIARERGLPAARVGRLIRANTTGRAAGFMGDPVVNVLKLNIALDGISANTAAPFRG
ncbi:potassium-transporting ATPase subunit C [Actinomadura verrucosospora]|uniref:Potassium-transporting ATPase KdpC subunit n=1 Tax=Actinomadura verrucosospora TaxID=46165 RepID=A0A7D3VWB4_ACTVE|nr:potassium-transporting ATPase subunit C [Actinomadura verrucosospora]QKG20332.1 potassium-transporting ATPase subunit KdpC [Actinomadura verrucosospora]